MVLYRRKKLVNCDSPCSTEMSRVLIELPALTGSDAASDCQRRKFTDRIQKGSESKQLLVNIEIYEVFRKGDIQKATGFTNKFIYGDKASLNLVQVRANKWNLMKNKATLQLPARR